MRTIESPAELAAWSRGVRAAGERIAFVPTMGFLHDGHLSLMREGALRADHLVASIFVNPLQFAPHEDLDRYPRDPEGDAAKCCSVGVDVLFTPERAALYPAGFTTTVVAGPVASVLCGRSRPGHFDGVCTVVLKLLNLLRPDVALFGRKDFQQLRVIERMVADLDVGVEIVGLPIVREPDGLAMSSRNAYLRPDEREQARVLSRALALAERLVAGGERDPVALAAAARALIEEQPLARVDYVEVADAGSLQPLPGPLAGPALLALAVRFGATRLIDNRVLSPGGSP